jgi:hypothetical protein
MDAVPVHRRPARQDLTKAPVQVTGSIAESEVDPVGERLAAAIARQIVQKPLGPAGQ